MIKPKIYILLSISFLFMGCPPEEPYPVYQPLQGSVLGIDNNGIDSVKIECINYNYYKYKGMDTTYFGYHSTFTLFSGQFLIENGIEEWYSNINTNSSPFTCSSNSHESQTVYNGISSMVLRFSHINYDTLTLAVLSDSMYFSDTNVTIDTFFFFSDDQIQAEGEPRLIQSILLEGL